MTQPSEQRDVALDYLRATAMILMIGAHCTSTLPQNHFLSPYLHVLAQSAATWFLFAFGMTTALFLSRPSQQQTPRLLFFLAVALLNNLFRIGLLFSTQILFTLWMVQALLLLVDGRLRRPDRAYALLFVGLLAALLLVPSESARRAFEQAFQFTQVGPFPLLPWALFVLAGLLFSRKRAWFDQHRTPVQLGLLLVNLALLPALSPTIVPSWFMAHPQFIVHNLPLSPAYLAFYLSLAVNLALLVDRFPRQCQQLPGLAPLVRVLSTQLLLAYVLHTVVTFPFRLLAVRWVTPATAPSFELAVRLGGWLLSVLAVATLTGWVSSGWQRLAQAAPLVKARESLPVVVVALLLACAAANGAVQAASQPAAHPATPLLGPGPLALLTGVVRWATWLGLVYLTLEMGQWRRKTRSAATPRSEATGAPA